MRKQSQHQQSQQHARQTSQRFARAAAGVAALEDQEAEVILEVYVHSHGGFDFWASWREARFGGMRREAGRGHQLEFSVKPPVSLPEWSPPQIIIRELSSRRR